MGLFSCPMPHSTKHPFLHSLRKQFEQRISVPFVSINSSYLLQHKLQVPPSSNTSIMTLGHHSTNPLTGTGLTGHHHTTGTGLTGTGVTHGHGVGTHAHHGTGALGAGTVGTAGVAATDTGAHASVSSFQLVCTLLLISRGIF